MSELNCSTWQLLALGFYMLIEFWLGRTKRLKSASVLELIVVGLVMMTVLILMEVRNRWPKSKP